MRKEREADPKRTIPFPTGMNKPMPPPIIVESLVSQRHINAGASPVDVQDAIMSINQILDKQIVHKSASPDFNQ